MSSVVSLTAWYIVVVCVCEHTVQPCSCVIFTVKELYIRKKINC